MQLSAPQDRNTKPRPNKSANARCDELQAGTFIEPTDLTVAEHLRSWHAEHARHHVSPRTHESYGYLLEAHIIPGLGGYKLAKLQPGAPAELLLEIASTPGRRQARCARNTTSCTRPSSTP